EASLLAARGNSGVILSQVLRGLCEGLSAATASDPRAQAGALAQALRHASEEADRAVATPQDGTVLSVLRDASEAGAWAAGTPGANPSAVVRMALEEARRSLDRTREIVPEMRRAGVVDAGAKGIVLL